MYSDGERTEMLLGLLFEARSHTGRKPSGSESIATTAQIFTVLSHEWPVRATR